MANDVHRPAEELSIADRRWVDEAFFLVFLLLAFIGVTPFKSTDVLAEQMGAAVQTGAGDSLRQICYLGIFTLIIIQALRHRGRKIIQALPLVLLGLLCWCFVSALWSMEPSVTVRRAGLATVLVFSAFLGVRSVGAERALVLWRWVLLLVLIVNLISVKFVPAAVHQAGELDPALVGNWRGVYGHKNIAGSVAAMTALLFLFSPSRSFWGKAFDLLGVAASIFFLIGTHSKSSMGLLVIALVAGAIYRLAWRREIDRSIALVSVCLVLLGIAVFATADSTVLKRVFDDPASFTGRAEIWKAEIAYIIDHPLFGSGFGTFSNTGKASPLAHYVGDWVTSANHGHNGYLQLLVTVGGIGFILAVISLVLQPIIGFWRREHVGFKSVLFALFVFLILHNLMETDFLEGDGVAWVGFLLLLAMLRDVDEVRP